MNVNQVIEQITAEKGFKVNYSQLAKVIGMQRQNIGRYKNDDLKQEHIEKIEEHYNISLGAVTHNLNAPQIKYFPNVFLSAGYGVEVHDEEYSYVVIDSQFLMSERVMRVDPKNCKLVRISGNSMFPEYHHGDRVIIDESDKNLTDGQIYAFRYDGQCYVKEINRAGNKIKCISVNKDYEPFFIERDVDFQVFGRIIPRVRL